MRFFPELRRNAGLPELLAVWLAVSCGLPFLSGLLSGAGWPRSSDVVFGVAALVFLAAASAVAGPVLLGRLRLEQALASAIAVLLLAAGASLALDLSGWWNDGSAYLVLRPDQALVSILSLGVWPLRSGPTALLRFWPLLVALGLVWRLRPYRLAPLRLAWVVGAVYAVLAVSVHSLSWIAGMLAAAHQSALETSSDVFRVLVSSQSGGYWAVSQGERFFAPLGRQAETGLAAVQSAVWFLAACAVLATCAARWRPMLRLARRLSDVESATWLLVSAFGIGIGAALGVKDRSYTSWLSLAIFVAVVVAWIWRQRLARDLDNLAEDERLRPELPLPSGLVAPHELEALIRLLGTAAFFGAALLGWTAVAALLMAETVSWLRSRRGLAWGGAWISDGASGFLVSLSLGAAGSTLGLRSFMLQPAQVATLAAASLVAAGTASLPWLERLPQRRPILMLAPSGGLLLALLVLRQPAVWAVGSLAVVGQLVVGWRPAWYGRWKYLPGLLLLFFLVFLALARPLFWDPD